MKKTDTLRNEVRHLLVDLPIKHTRADLAALISNEKDQVNAGSLTMALSGLRDGKRSRELLEKLKAILT